MENILERYNTPTVATLLSTSIIKNSSLMMNQ
jgi:hypothetical protein